MLWSGNESGFRSQWGVTLSLHCLSGCVFCLGQGETADAVGSPSGAEAASWLAGNEMYNWSYLSCSPDTSLSSFAIPQISRGCSKPWE